MNTTTTQVWIHQGKRATLSRSYYQLLSNKQTNKQIVNNDDDFLSLKEFIALQFNNLFSDFTNKYTYLFHISRPSYKLIHRILNIFNCGDNIIENGNFAISSSTFSINKFIYKIVSKFGQLWQDISSHFCHALWFTTVVYLSNRMSNSTLLP